MRKPVKKLSLEETDALTVEAINRGSKSNGAVAVDANIGATSAYQSVARLVSTGILKQSKTGELSVV